MWCGGGFIISAVRSMEQQCGLSLCGSLTLHLLSPGRTMASYGLELKDCRYCIG